jgi:hypothetical protein
MINHTNAKAALAEHNQSFGIRVVQSAVDARHSA